MFISEAPVVVSDFQQGRAEQLRYLEATARTDLEQADAQTQQDMYRFGTHESPLPLDDTSYGRLVDMRKVKGERCYDSSDQIAWSRGVQRIAGIVPKEAATDTSREYRLGLQSLCLLVTAQPPINKKHEPYVDEKEVVGRAIGQVNLSRQAVLCAGCAAFNLCGVRVESDEKLTASVRPKGSRAKVSS